jgi:hypothetical protein
MAIRDTYRIHLTPRGWERGSPPSDTLESWEVEVGPGETLEPGKARPRRLRKGLQTSSRNSRDLQLARINHGKLPRI